MDKLVLIFKLDKQEGSEMKDFTIAAAYKLFILSALMSFAVGCGPGEVVMPEGGLTAEQQAAVAAEDAAVEDEESGGMYKDGKKVKK